jgi:hypothetical protein
VTDSNDHALVCAVACKHPPRFGESSRFADLFGFARNPFCVAAILAVFALASGLLVGPRTMHVFAESKSDIAKATVKKYAFEAYPSWRAQHPNLVCPARLVALNEYMNNKDIKDPWGGTYGFSCDDSGIRVWSRGEDGVSGTGDDIRSDE